MIKGAPAFHYDVTGGAIGFDNKLLIIRYTILLLKLVFSLSLHRARLEGITVLTLPAFKIFI